MNKLFILSLVVISVFTVSCGQKKQAAGNQMRATRLPVIKIPARDITGETTYPVRIKGIVNSEVRAKISGYITHVFVDEGDKVRKGQPLFRLETRSLTEDAQAAKANVDAAQVAVNQLKPLVEKNIVSKIQLETANAKLAQAKANYQSITANIGYANINSPIDGYVGAIVYRQGSLVNPSSPSPLTVVSKTNEVYAYFSMNEADYVDFLQHTPGETLSDKMKHFPKVKLQMANGDIYKHEGDIQAVTAQVDPTTGTVSFRATFPNPEHLIANGSSGTILIPKLYKDAILVPAQSTFEIQNKTYVFQLAKDSTVSPAVIDIEDEIGNTIIVKSGIKAGTEIVAQGAGTLHDKEKIVPIPTPFDSVNNSIQTVFQ